MRFLLARRRSLCQAPCPCQLEQCRAQVHRTGCDTCNYWNMGAARLPRARGGFNQNTQRRSGPTLIFPFAILLCSVCSDN